MGRLMGTVGLIRELVGSEIRARETDPVMCHTIIASVCVFK